jgi:ankyrin repeat protein
VNSSKKNYKLIILLIILYNIINTIKCMEQETYFGYTPLFFAARNNNTEKIKQLIDMRAHINHVSITGTTALSLASMYGHKNAVMLLLNAGAQINSADYDGRTALMTAVAHGNYEITNILIAKKAHIHNTDQFGFNALMLACIHAHADIVQKLLQSKAQPHSATSTGWTPLAYAIPSIFTLKNSPEIIEHNTIIINLIQAGARDDNNKIRQLALKRNFPECAQLINYMLNQQNPITQQCYMLKKRISRHNKIPKKNTLDSITETSDESTDQH